MSRIGDFFRRLFGVEKVGKFSLNYLSVLLYLERTPKEQRATSAEKLEKDLVIAPRTIVSAFHALLESKYIALESSEAESTNPYEVRDSSLFVVTPLGRKALKPFTATFGYFTVILLTCFSCAFGVMLGIVIFSLAIYPEYWYVYALVSVPFFVVMIIAFYSIIMDEKHGRQMIVALALRKK